MKNKSTNSGNVLSRESTGINEIDLMIQGGLPSGSVIGLSGPPGVGKSIFSLHFLLEGARKGQKCVYVNLEEPRRNIDNMINQFNFANEFFEFEKKGLIVVKCFEYSEYEKIYSELFERIKNDSKIRRLVVDSFNCFFNSVESSHSNGFDIKKIIASSFNQLRRFGLTSLLILEKGDEHKSNFDYNIPYLVDGMLRFDFLDLGVVERRLFIPKMRWTGQHNGTRSFDITSKGISIKEDD